MLNAIEAYETVELMPVAPGQGIVLLYRHLLGKLRRAAECERRSDLAGRVAHLFRAFDVVQELYAALDFEAGGEIARRLAALYAFFSAELLSLVQRRNPGRLNRLAAMVESLLEVWEGAARSDTNRAAQRAERG